MRTILFSLLALSLTTACEGRDPVDTDTDTDTDTDSDTDTDADGDIPDYWEDLGAHEGCEDYDGYPVPGATGFFMGDFSISGEEVSGHETWALFANQAWKDAGEDDCEILWSVSGTVGSPVACATCDLSLDLTAQVSPADSSCPEKLFEGEESFAVTYDVRVNSDGTTDFYYASSGNELGGWYGNDHRVTYVTDGQCHWF